MIQNWTHELQISLKASQKQQAQGSGALRQNSDKSAKQGLKMTGALFYEILESRLQAWAFGLSLLGPDKGPRTEN